MYADQTKVRQILLNLLGNAAKFTQQGRITLSIARERAAEGGEWVRFRVADTGIGMTPEQVQDLFQPFTQADGPATRQYGGTGLGLAISQRFCQLMGGEIRVESELDLGSTFTVRLPAMVTERPVEPVQPMEKPSRIVRPLPAGAVDLSKEAGTVLIIDDDPAARDLIGHWLTEEGFHIETTSSGEEGLRLARERHPDVITLDVQMPGMDGWVVLSALKADPDLAPIPVILVTVADDRNQGFALGASDYLLKPIDRESLLSVLRKYRRGAPPGQILIVEDDATMREMLHRVLEKEHWMVTEARNGRVALQRVTEHPPDLILLDLMMAEMDGFEFLTELRKTPAWRTIPVVVVTAKDLTPEDRRRLNSHVERILQKGVYSREELLREIRDLVATHMHRDHDQDVSPPALSEAARRSLGHAN
jgi:CheY-like chemotaxis protein